MDIRDIRMRWLIKKDLPSVCDIDENIFGHDCWKRKDFVNALSGKSTIGMTCEYKNENLGYIVYTLRSQSIHIVRICVDPLYMHMGIGTFMIRRMIEKIDSSSKRNLLTITIDEDNLIAQLFLRKCGLKADKIIRGDYNENDSYLFVYKQPVTSEPSS